MSNQIPNTGIDEQHAPVEREGAMNTSRPITSPPENDRIDAARAEMRDPVTGDSTVNTTPSSGLPTGLIVAVVVALILIVLALILF